MKKKKSHTEPYVVRVDASVLLSDGTWVIRQGMTPHEMELAANAMGQLSNLRPMIFGPEVR